MVQSREERVHQEKKVTADLRKHISLLEKDKAEVVDPSSDKLNEYFDQNDLLHDASSLVLHQNLVTQSFLQLSQAAKVQSSRLQASLKNYSSVTFVQQLVAEMNSHEPTQRSTETSGRNSLSQEELYFDFEAFGEKHWRKYKFAPRIDFMYGLHDLQPKEQKKRKLNEASQRPTTVAKPVTVGRDDQTSKTEADKQIELMSTELKKRKKLGLYEFALAPDNFARSVENLFYTAFLVKDGRAKVTASREKIVIDSIQRDKSAAEAEQESRESRQVIVKFDYKRWRKSTADGSVQQCLFPSTGQRQDADVSTQDNLQRRPKR